MASATPAAPLLYITGASSGIGQALAARFAQAGYRLALVARRGDFERSEVRALVAWSIEQFQVPAALVSFVHGELAIFRSEVGLGESALPRNVSVSNILVGMGPGAHFVVEDARVHPVLKDHPMVAGHPFIRFFAGTTVSNGNGEPVGAVGNAYRRLAAWFGPPEQGERRGVAVPG